MFYHEVYVTVCKYCDDLDIYEEETVPGQIEDNLNLYIAFLFQKKYYKIYNERNWYLEPGAREFVSDIERKWLDNTLDWYAISSDSDFKRFLQEEYISNASVEPSLLDEILSDFENDIKMQLDDYSIEDLEEIGNVDVAVECNDISYSSFIDVDDIIEDKRLEEEDDD